MKFRNPSSLPVFVTLLALAVFFATFFSVSHLGWHWLYSFLLAILACRLSFIVVATAYSKKVFEEVLAKQRYMVPMNVGEFTALRELNGCGTSVAEPIPVPGDAMNPSKVVDFSQLQTTSAELQTLGFQLCREGHWRAEDDVWHGSFVRVYEHPSGCRAIAALHVASAGAPQTTCSITSAFEDGWTGIDSNNPPNCYMYMGRQPRFIGKRHLQNESTAHLWEFSAERNDKIQRELGVRQIPQKAADLEMFINRLNADVLAALKRKNLLVGILECIFIMPLSTEWWGEYAKHIKKANG